MITEAIKNLRPNADFRIEENNIETLIWLNGQYEPITTAELTAEVKRLEKAEADKIKADQTATAAAIAHAKSLGFTDQMIAVMYPNLGSQ
jgi:hypothetical protein